MAPLPAKIRLDLCVNHGPEAERAAYRLGVIPEGAMPTEVYVRTGRLADRHAVPGAVVELPTAADDPQPLDPAAALLRRQREEIRARKAGSGMSRRSNLYRFARQVNDVEALASGKSHRVLRRVKNRIIGRVTVETSPVASPCGDVRSVDLPPRGLAV